MKILQILKNSKKILGQNARNQIFIKKDGSAHGREIADDKLLTKKMLEESQISAPKLLGVIKNSKELRAFEWDSLPKSFVMKPVRGSQGDGIEIFYSRDTQGNWIRGDGIRIGPNELAQACQDILDGIYSLDKEQDKVFFEERIRPHKELRNYTFKGTPDIRVVVYNKVPIQAYARFPTKESKGKANMVIGAVGSGIDLSTGVTTSSVKGKSHGGRGESIEYIPGTKLSYRGLKIPYWKRILELAIKCQQAIKLDFVAIDFLIDNDKGPVIVEINARPGLSIQLVNRAGMAWRLEKVKDLKVKTIEQGIRIAQDLFGGEVEKTIERISGKELISNVMPVIINYENKSFKALALIDTSRRTTTIDTEVATELGIMDSESPEKEYLITDVELLIGNQKLNSTCKVIPRTESGYKVYIGRKDLSGFLIDIKKIDEKNEFKLREMVIGMQPKTPTKKMDLIIKQLSGHISIVKMVHPINLSEEKNKFFDSGFTYNPQFEYKAPRFDPDEYLNKLNMLNPSSSPIGMLYKERINEARKIIFLIESIGKGAETFTKRSVSLYGTPTRKIVRIAKKILNEYIRDSGSNDNVVLDINQVLEQIKIVLKKYKIDSKIVLTSKVDKASVGKSTGKISINPKYKWTQEAIDTVLAHEIETHVVKKSNGSKQKYGIFEFGTAGYLKTEEGIATLMKRSRMKKKTMWIGALKTYALSIALEKSFVDTFQRINSILNNPEKSWKTVLRLKRGIGDTSQPGAFTKDQYFGWAIEIGNELLGIKDTDDIRFVFNGKGNLQDLKNHTVDVSKIYPKLTKDMIAQILKANFAL